MVKSVAIMRRRADSWLNATQILKIAGFDKPQRTRVLEREVQKGEHEKVQGGYGKYQGEHYLTVLPCTCSEYTWYSGTWVPLDKGIALAKQHNIDHLMKPLIEFQPAATSPPLAPKHLSAPARPKRGRDSTADGPTGSMSLRSSKRGAETPTECGSPTPLGSDDGSMTTSPGTASATSRTPSPIRSTPAYPVDESDQLASPPHRATRARTAANAKHRSSYRAANTEPMQPPYASEDEAASSQIDYADAMLEYFISESTQIPTFLISPPIDFDPNMAIDEEGHAALHWACAMGRIRIIKLLLTVGADIFRTNAAGQTPLMRGVMFSNNYDVRKFPELYELLHRSTLNIDHTNRTVFHHIVDLAMTKGKTHAARYYMETILNRLSEFPNELADIINFQAEDGETALTLAARCRSKRLVKLLIDHGADPKIANKEGKSAEDYILEDERFRSSPVPPSRVSGMSYRNAHASIHVSGQHGNGYAGPSTSNGVYGYAKLPLHHSVVAQRASTTCIDDMASMLDSLANSFDAELQEKERDLSQAHALLNNIDAEIAESQKAVEVLKRQAEGLEESKMRLRDLEQTLKFKMGRRYQLGWTLWLREEENREHEFFKRADVLDGSMMNSPDAEDQDLIDLHTGIPTNPEELAKACDELRQDIVRHHMRRKETFDALIKQQAEAGTGGRMPEYRRLIGAGCGGVPPAEVDNVLGLLLEVSRSRLSWLCKS